METNHTPKASIEYGMGIIDAGIDNGLTARECLELRKCFAAGPELLELVKELYEYCGPRLNNSSCIRVEGTIAKAEGK
jgi:hypothetical protein